MEFHLKKKLDDSSHFYSERKSRIFKEKTQIYIFGKLYLDFSFIKLFFMAKGTIYA